MVGGCYYLHVHPDLGLVQARKGDKELTLLGYIIDPEHPKYSDEEVLDELISKISDRLSLFKATMPFGGRWILFYSDGVDVIAFNDACGLRSLYFTRSEIKQFTCGSQPGLINRQLNFHYSESARRDFLDTPVYREKMEYWMPSGRSLYDEIEQLIPNHYLDLNNGVQRRFWPWERLEKVSYRDGVTKVGDLLEKLIIAAAERFRLAVTVTAGYDTRSIFAATRKVSPDVYYYTMLYYNLTHQSPDVDIPHKILASCGIKHHILDCSGQMSNDFREIYMNNVDLAHEAWGHIASGLIHTFPHDHISVKGVCSEIARFTSSRFGYLDTMDGKTLASLFALDDSPFIVEGFDQWAQNSMMWINKYKYRFLDVLYWEHRLGNWQAQSQLEWDIVHETFSPYNCRELLVLLLGVDGRYRKKPGNRLMIALMKYLWPAASQEPFNPRPMKVRFRKKFRLYWRSEKVKKIREIVKNLFDLP